MLTALAASGQAPATSEPAVSLSTPENCGSKTEFYARLRALAGERAETLAGSVSIAAQDTGGYSLNVQTPDVQRALQNESCQALLESAAVIVALGATTREPEKTPGPAPVPPPPAPAAPRVTAPRRELHLAPSLEVGGAFGLVPGISARSALGLALHGKRVGGMLSADYVAPRETDGQHRVRVQGPGVSGLLTVALHRRVRVAAGADVHLLLGRGRGVSHVRTGLVPLWAAKLELTCVPLIIGANELAIALAAALPVTRHRFYIRDGGDYRPAAYQLLAGLRFTYDFRVR